MNTYYLLLIDVALVVYILYLAIWNQRFQKRIEVLQAENETLVKISPGYTFEGTVPLELVNFVNSYSETGIESTQRRELRVVHGSYPRDCKLDWNCTFPECGCGR
jgi:hypothetical protein